MAPHYSIVEGNHEYGCISLSPNLIGYSTTQSLVEDGIPRSLLWHYLELAPAPNNVYERIEVLPKYLGPKEI